MFIDPAKFLDLVLFSDENITKSTAFNLESAQNGSGTFVSSITGVTNANQGLPDYFVDVTFSGLTFPEYDPDKKKILTMHEEALYAVQSFTPAGLTSVLGFVAPGAVVGIINIESSFSYDGSFNIFRLNFRLVTADAYIAYQESPISWEAEEDDDGMLYLHLSFIP